jgi:hypothetical protein
LATGGSLLRLPAGINGNCDIICGIIKNYVGSIQTAGYIPRNNLITAIAGTRAGKVGTKP